MSTAALARDVLDAVTESSLATLTGRLLLEKRQMNALLIYPEFPQTFWSFKRALKFLGKRATQHPKISSIADWLHGHENARQ